MLILAAAVVALNHLVVAVDPDTLRAAQSSTFVRKQLAPSETRAGRVIVYGANTYIELRDASTLAKGEPRFAIAFTVDRARDATKLPRTITWPAWLRLLDYRGKSRSALLDSAKKPLPRIATPIFRDVTAVTLLLDADDARKLGAFLAKSGGIRGLELRVRIAPKTRGITSIEVAADAPPAADAVRIGASLVSCSAPTACVWRFE
jgi:hypothetical protein